MAVAHSSNNNDPLRHVRIGFVEGRRISTVLRSKWWSGVSGTALVTCIDSLRFATELDVRKVFAMVEQRGCCREFGFECPAAALPDIVNEYPRLFCGFDEVWIFEPGRCIMRNPSLSLTAEYALPDQVVTSDGQLRLRDAGSWMEASGSVLGLGDGTGIGLNYISTLREYEEKLLEALQDESTLC